MQPVLPSSRPGTPLPGLNSSGDVSRPTTPINEASTNIFYRFWKWIQEFFYDYFSTIAYGIGLIAGGILFAPAIPAVLTPCLGAGIGVLTSAVVTKTMKRYTIIPLTTLQNFSLELSRDYPQVHIIAFITTIFLGSFYPPIGFAAGAAVGLLGGFTSHPEMLDGQRSVDNHGRLRRSTSNGSGLFSTKA